MRNLKLEEDRKPTMKALKKASEALLDHYVALVNSGDAGHWNPEEEKEVQTLRSILGRLK